MLSSLACVSAHWYCGFLYLSSQYISWYRFLGSCQPHLLYTHSLSHQFVLYEVSHIQFIFIGDQLSCISSLHQSSISQLHQPIFKLLVDQTAAFISHKSSTPTILSYWFINQHMTSKYIINTVSFINNQLWYLIACCLLTQEIEIIDNWFNSQCFHWSPVIYYWLLGIDTESYGDYLAGILDPICLY